VNKNFVRIKNEFLDNTEDDNIFVRVGTEGMLLYTYFRYIAGNNDTFQVSIKMIHQFINRDYANRPDIIYSKKKVYKIGLLQDKKTIVKYIKALEKEKLIIIKNDTKYKLNDFMLIELVETEYIKGFTAVSNELFIKYIPKIGHIGWSLLLILTKLFNNTYGGTGCEGFANPSEAYLSRIIKRDIETVRAYLYLLQKQKLIKIELQPVIQKGTDKYGKNIFEYTPNHYIVKNKLIDNKYYLFMVKKENEQNN